MTVDVRVEAVVSGRLAASSRFRVIQHVEPLRALGVEVSARPPRDLQVCVGALADWLETG